MTRTHHALDHVEVAVSDLERARAFYRDAFGWQFNDYGPSCAGIRSLDGTAAAVAAAGGVVTQGPYAFPGGRRFHFTDPDGTALGVWGA